jgi:hypothetical protein
MVYYKNLDSGSVKTLLSHYGIEVNCIDVDVEIPHSFWGAPEAGRKKEQLYIRGDTPIHSILHEACHYICMPAAQRKQMLVDAKGSAMEENATCYLQILLSDHIENYDRRQLMQDMDDWGYSFRLGSANAWFNKDADEVCQWLREHQIINMNDEITWKLKLE